MNTLETQLYTLIGQAPDLDLDALVQCVDADQERVRSCLRELEEQGEIRSKSGGYRIVSNDERPAHQRRPANITIDDLTFDADGNPLLPVLTIPRPIPCQGLVLTPDRLGEHDYWAVCELIGLEPIGAGYGALLVEYEHSRARATFLTRDVAWVEAIIELLERTERDEPAQQPTELEVNPQVLGEKVVASFEDWPTTWDGQRPEGGITPTY